MNKTGAHEPERRNWVNVRKSVDDRIMFVALGSGLLNNHIAVCV